ncbi:hypothetical protein BDY21DRAFT_194010 [Lineolata rhizophorae]|uniref:Uncharacterized protein n=1 Tax=Lineolata rhizophorae TaxID=578093 RepID=A0A6A6P6K7_9PEZI|nr:hypothetical protein BDY21DRAFT_194010 [Lineolata rhizophorae]
MWSACSFSSLLRTSKAFLSAAWSASSSLRLLLRSASLSLSCVMYSSSAVLRRDSRSLILAFAPARLSSTHFFCTSAATRLLSASAYLSFHVSACSRALVSRSLRSLFSASRPLRWSEASSSCYVLPLHHSQGRRPINIRIDPPNHVEQLLRERQRLVDLGELLGSERNLALEDAVRLLRSRQPSLRKQVGRQLRTRLRQRRPGHAVHGSDVGGGSVGESALGGGARERAD